MKYFGSLNGNMGKIGRTAPIECDFLKYVLDLKFLNFINGLRYLKDSPAKLLYNWFGVDEYKSITCKYDIACTDNSST